MGLDMYLEGHVHHLRRSERDGYTVKKTILELGYWRKHPNLHGYIVQEFAEGKDDCQKIELTKENIKQIISAIEAKALPETTGCFFGASDGTEDEESIFTFRKALMWLAEEPKNELGSKTEMRWVVYRASW